MRKGLLICAISLLAVSLMGQERLEQKLAALFDEAEQCYLMDDYQQLYDCIEQYVDIFDDRELADADSADVYRAYYFKMCGSYYYGWAEDSIKAGWSEDYYLYSLRIFKRMVTNWNVYAMHRNEVTLHEELAQLYYKTKDYEKALAHLDTVYIYLDNKSDIASLQLEYFNVVAQRAICNARLGRFPLALEQIEEALGYFKRNHKENYHETLRKKGKILMLQADRLGAKDFKKAIDCYRKYVDEQYTAIDKQLAGMNSSQRAQYWLAIHQFLYDCFRLGNQAPDMLYDLALFSKGYLIAYENNHKSTQKSWKQVRRELGRKDCAIEFVQYFGRDEEMRMGCLVLKHDSSKPRFIDLFATDSLLNIPLTQYNTIGDALSLPTPALKDTLYSDPRLPAYIWSPQLMDAIGDAKKVYFAADGFIQQCAIEYLMPDTGKVCYRMSSTRNIQKRHDAPKLQNALICGGITYNERVETEENGNDPIAYRFLSSSNAHISELPDARKEVDSIYFCRSNPLDTLLVGSAATDVAFIDLLKKGYDVVHLSTHGFFGGRIGIYNDIKPLRGDESMSKSGLIFAGAANNLTDKSFDVELRDGVLSGAEIAKLDFSGTELIVLSACETGLGHLTADGVYGIQRALKQAGAQAMIVSLWRVNDISCSMLMRFFYEELQQQKQHDIHAAFLKARSRLQHAEVPYFRFDVPSFSIVKDNMKYDTPHHLNPFIIIDAY